MSLGASVLRYMLFAAIAGIVTLFLGIPIPRRIFRWDRFPFKCYPFEKDGSIYTKLYVHKWKDLAPDASKVISQMAKKRIQKNVDANALERLIQETCVAEMVHWILIALTPVYCIGIPACTGIGLSVLYALGNLVFIVIQRYNRPRFSKALHLMKMRETKMKGKREKEHESRFSCSK